MGNKFKSERLKYKEEYEKYCKEFNLLKIKYYVESKKIDDELIIKRIKELCKEYIKRSENVMKEIIYYSNYYNIRKNEKMIKEILGEMIINNIQNIFEMEIFYKWIKSVKDIKIYCVNLACINNRYEHLKHVFKITKLHDMNEYKTGYERVVKNNNSQIFSLFLKNGYDVYEVDNRCIKYCIINKHDSIAKMIMKEKKFYESIKPNSKREKGGLLFLKASVFKTIKTKNSEYKIYTNEEYESILNKINNDIEYDFGKDILLKEIDSDMDKNREYIFKEFKNTFIEENNT